MQRTAQGAYTLNLIDSRDDTNTIMGKLSLKVQFEVLNFYKVCDIQNDIWVIRWGKLLRGHKLFLIGISD